MGCFLLKKIPLYYSEYRLSNFQEPSSIYTFFLAGFTPWVGYLSFRLFYQVSLQELLSVSDPGAFIRFGGLRESFVVVIYRVSRE